jgi:hypothetical protein
LEITTQGHLGRPLGEWIGDAGVAINELSFIGSHALANLPLLAFAPYAKSPPVAPFVCDLI